MATAASASRRETEVWVRPAGLIRMKSVPSSRAAWTRSTRACSALDWKLASSWPFSSRPEEQTSELPSPMRTPYAAVCLNKKKERHKDVQHIIHTLNTETL